MIDRTASRDALLRRLVRADLALRKHDQRERFRVRRLESHAGQQITHSGLRETGERDWIECNRQDVDDLNSAGLIRLEKHKRSAKSPRGASRVYFEEWEFDITDAGFRASELSERAAAEHSETDDVKGGLDWQRDVLPVLKAAYEASQHASLDLGISQAAINERLGREENDKATGRVLTALVDADYMTATVDTFGPVEGPAYARLTEKGLQVTAGWPSGAPDAAYVQLLELLDKRVDEAASDAERSKWKRLRDAVAGVGRDVGVEVLSALAQAGIRGVT